MAILTTHAVQSTVTSLRNKIRNSIGDATSTRWTNQEIYDSIDNTLRWMYNQVLSGDAHRATTTVDMTYTANALAVDLPTGTELRSIFRVMDVTDSSILPIYVEYIDPMEIDRHGQIYNAWTFNGGQLSLRPYPTSQRTLRITTINTPILVGTPSTPDTDQLPFAVNFEELIVTDAAARLQEVDSEVPKGRAMRLQELKEQFIEFAATFKGPTYVSNVRSWV